MAEGNARLRRRIESYAKAYGITAKQAEKVMEAREKWSEILAPLGKATCSKDVQQVYDALSAFFFEMPKKEPEIAKLLGKDLAEEMFSLSRNMNAEKSCIQPEGLSLALWEIAHRNSPVMKKDGKPETYADLAKKLDEASSLGRAMDAFDSFEVRLREAKTIQDATRTMEQLNDYLDNLAKKDPLTYGRIRREVSERVNEIPPPMPRASEASEKLNELAHRVSSAKTRGELKKIEQEFDAFARKLKEAHRDAYVMLSMQVSEMGMQFGELNYRLDNKRESGMTQLNGSFMGALDRLGGRKGKPTEGRSLADLLKEAEAEHKRR